MASNFKNSLIIHDSYISIINMINTKDVIICLNFSAIYAVFVLSVLSVYTSLREMQVSLSIIRTYE